MVKRSSKLDTTELEDTKLREVRIISVKHDPKDRHRTKKTAEKPKRKAVKAKPTKQRVKKVVAKRGPKKQQKVMKAKKVEKKSVKKPTTTTAKPAKGRSTRNSIKASTTSKEDPILV